MARQTLLVERLAADQLVGQVTEEVMFTVSDPAIVAMITDPFWQYNPPATRLVTEEYQRRLRVMRFNERDAQAWAGFERSVMLQTLDGQWREHLSALDHLRQGIHLRGYAQKNPKQEYKREAFELFSQLLDVVKMEVTRLLMTVRIQSGEQLDEAAQEMESRADSISNVTYSAPTETGEVETTVLPGVAQPGSPPILMIQPT